ncbi:MAG: hypothetical protein NTW87_10975 [Planctomycetota bacterium]|nr:hypothetical protein [Planctomycetota bacterium]
MPLGDGQFGSQFSKGGVLKILASGVAVIAGAALIVTALKIKDSAGDHTISFVGGADEAADRTITIPPLGGNKYLAPTSDAAGQVTSAEIKDGTIANSDIAPGAAIADTKLATITAPGKVADSALSSNVALKNAANVFTQHQLLPRAYINCPNGLSDHPNVRLVVNPKNQTTWTNAALVLHPENSTQTVVGIAVPSDYATHVVDIFREGGGGGGTIFQLRNTGQLNVRELVVFSGLVGDATHGSLTIKPPPTLGSTGSYSFPANPTATGRFLTSDTSGVMSWSTNGASLIGLDASALASGTIPDARMPSTLPRLNAQQTWTNNNTFNSSNPGNTPLIVQSYGISKLVANMTSALALEMTSDMKVSWYAGTSFSGNPDVALERSGTNSLRVTNGSSGSGNLGVGFLQVAEGQGWLSGAVNDYALPNVGVLRVTATPSDASVSGMSGGVAGRTLLIYNVGAANDVYLLHESTSSALANRFSNTSGTSIRMKPGEGASGVYDSVSLRWRMTARQ